MKAVAVFPRDKKVSIIDHPEPEVTSATGVKARMLEVGVCGTDREIICFEYGTPPEGSAYFVLGHESLAEVVAVGKEVRSVKLGDLIVFTVRRPCPENCAACAAGRQDFCYTGHFKERGITRAHGFMTEFAVDEECYVNRVPGELRDIGILTEPLTIAEKAYDQIEKVLARLPWTQSARREQLRAVVLGAGPVGLLGAMKMVTEGYQTYVYSRKTEVEKPPIVEAMGAKFIATEDVPPQNLAEACGGNIDVVYEAIGAPDLAFEVIQALGRNAIFVFTGVPGRQHPISFDTGHILRDMVWTGKMLFGTMNAGPMHFQAAIDDLLKFKNRFPQAIGKLITHRFSIEDYDKPLATPGGIKNVISLSQ